MRKWIKYYNDRRIKGKVFQDKSSAAEEHAKDMGGYHLDETYKNKTDFFEAWYLNQNDGRLEVYNQFIQGNLYKKDKILSLASGRSSAELYLMEKGYDISCSDLEELIIHRSAKLLFPSFRFFPLNILRSSSPEKYDAVTALSVLYLFDDDELNCFFENVSVSLNDGGSLILDPGGASDSLITLLIDNFLLKFEACVQRIILFCLNKPCAAVEKHHGFRRSDQEIVTAAKAAGFVLLDTKHDDFLSEFRRSPILGALLKRSNLAKKVISVIGRRAPYIRLFMFKRIE